MDRRVEVGILPAAQHRARPRLFAALEEAYPVRFQGHQAGATRGLEAILAFGSGGGDGDGGATPDLTLPSLTLHGEETSGQALRSLALATHPALARALRGAVLTDGHATTLPSVGAHEVVLAELKDAAAWVLDPHPRAQSQRVASAPAELGTDEALRERLRPGRSLALLALAHFLAELTAHLRPRRPPLQAAFVIDDPNLRRPRYGHLDYAELLSEARRHGYHLSVAMVPLDARLAHPRATQIFREGAEHLSLCIHGNDHRGPELGGIDSEAQALALLTQALRRTAAFERRTGLAVDRVMAPPHERLSEPVARALRRCGFDAVTTTRPYPWAAESLADPWLTRPADAGPLAAWRPIDRIAGGLPVLLRADFRLHPREDLVLRAFLGQPLILYGHHDLLAGGPGALAAAAAQIDRLGDVRWSSLAGIARAHAPKPAHAPNGSPAQDGLTPSHPLNGSSAQNGPEEPLLDLRAHRAPAVPSGRLAPLLRRLASEGRDRGAGAAGRFPVQFPSASGGNSSTKRRDFFHAPRQRGAGPF